MILRSVDHVWQSLFRNSAQTLAQQTIQSIAKISISARELQRLARKLHRNLSWQVKKTLREFRASLCLSRTAVFTIKNTVY